MKLVSAALFAVLLPTVAAAQNSGVYIQAGPLADFLFTANAGDFPVSPLSTSSPSYTWNDLNGDRRWQPGEDGSAVSTSLLIGFPSFVPRSRSRVAPGAAAALGVFITPSVSLRVEGSYQGEHVTETNFSDVRQSITFEDRQATSTTDIFVAAGWHQGESRRTTITYLGGMVFRRQREEAALRYFIGAPTLPSMIGLGGQPVFGPLTLFDEEFGSTSYSAGIMAGVDVSINLSTHFAVVPQVRMVAAGGALSVRPAVSMRWRP
jgi:hypothetical protein